MYSSVCTWWYVWKFNGERIEVTRYACVRGEGKEEGEAVWGRGDDRQEKKIGAVGHEGK